MVDVQVGVHLGGGQADVTEQFLDGAQIRAHLEQVGGERVAQAVRGDTHADAGAQAVALHEPLHRPRAQARAPAVEEQGLTLGLTAAGGAGKEERIPLGQVLAQGLAGGPAKRNEPFLVALAADPHHLLGPVEVREVGGHQFRHTHAGRVEQLQHRPVPPPVPVHGGGRLDQGEHLVHGEKGRDVPAAPGSDHPGQRVGGKNSAAAQKTEEGAQGRELARHRGARVGRVQAGDEGTDRDRGDPVGRAVVAAEADEFAQVALVTGRGVGRIPLFHQQPGEERFDLGDHRQREVETTGYSV